MSTVNILEKAVKVGEENINAHIGNTLSKLDQINSIPEELRTENEEELFKILKASKQSLPLLNVETAIKAGGIFPNRLPRLAIAPYFLSIDNEPLYAVVSSKGGVQYTDQDDHTCGNYNRFPNVGLPMPKGLFEFLPFYPRMAGTAVPLVPALLRQKDNRNLYVLFEVEEWSLVRRVVDPYLLKHISGSIYAILGAWDVTNLEIKSFQVAKDLGI